MRQNLYTIIEVYPLCLYLGCHCVFIWGVRLTQIKGPEFYKPSRIYLFKIRHTSRFLKSGLGCSEGLLSSQCVAPSLLEPVSPLHYMHPCLSFPALQSVNLMASGHECCTTVKAEGPHCFCRSCRSSSHHAVGRS